MVLLITIAAPIPRLQGGAAEMLSAIALCRHIDLLRLKLLLILAWWPDYWQVTHTHSLSFLSAEAYHLQSGVIMRHGPSKRIAISRPDLYTCLHILSFLPV